MRDMSTGSATKGQNYLIHATKRHKNYLVIVGGQKKNSSSESKKIAEQTQNNEARAVQAACKQN